MLSKPSIAEAAKAAKVGERTLWRWLEFPEFKEKYRAARSQIVIQSVAQMQSALTEAVKTLKDVMENAKAPASARVSAAKAVIDMSLRSVELEDLLVRIEIIETAIEVKTQ